MSSTSIRISQDTREMVIKTRGILEQLFRRRLSLDDTMYLASRLIYFIYGTVQKLDAQNRIKIVETSDGAFKLELLENVADVVPYVVEEITEIKDKLAEREKKTSRLMVTVKK